MDILKIMANGNQVRWSLQLVVLFTGIIMVIVEVMDISILNIEDIMNQKVISGRFNN